MPIVPDEKDWTWVLSRPCPVRLRRVHRDAVDCSRQRRKHAAALAGRAPAAGRRPSGRTSSTWSALEYACHVRDVFSLFDRRLNLMLTRTTPGSRTGTRTKQRWTSDYANADPAVVSAELTAEGSRWRSPSPPSEGVAVGPDRAAQQRLGVHRPDARAVFPARRRPSPCGRGRLIPRRGCHEVVAGAP
jgi:hypothetical protein